MMKFEEWVAQNKPDRVRDDPNFLMWVWTAKRDHVTYTGVMYDTEGRKIPDNANRYSISINTPEPVILMPIPSILHSICDCDDTHGYFDTYRFVSEARQLLADYTAELERVIAEADQTR